MQTFSMLVLEILTLLLLELLTTNTIFSLYIPPSMNMNLFRHWFASVTQCITMQLVWVQQSSTSWLLDFFFTCVYWLWCVLCFTWCSTLLEQATYLAILYTYACNISTCELTKKVDHLKLFSCKWLRFDPLFLS